MNHKIRIVVALLLAVLNSPRSTLHAQGSLTPPGAPAPTMKSLAQIEPRTPISSAPFNITNSGSYYLTTNLTTTTVTNAIVITANEVTLDLNGFTIFSSSAATNAFNGGEAILLFGSPTIGLSDITILNGHIRGGLTNNGSGVYGGPGFFAGIDVSGNTPVNVRVSGVSVLGCYYGINLGSGDSLVVEGCTVRTTSADGIVASIIKSSVGNDCGGYGIRGEHVSDCRGQASGSGIGVDGITVQNCFGSSSSGYGVYAIGTALNCYGASSGGTGLNASGSALNCYGSSFNGTGLNAFIANGCHGVSTLGTALSTSHNVNSF